MSNAQERVRDRLRRYLGETDRPTQQEFAKALGRTQPWFSKMLKTGPSARYFDAIAEIMGLTTSELVAPLEDGESQTKVTSAKQPRRVRGFGERLAALERLVAFYHRSDPEQPPGAARRGSQKGGGRVAQKHTRAS